MPRPLVIVGAGGFGKEAAWVAESDVAGEWQILGYADDDSEKVETRPYGHPVLGDLDHVVSRFAAGTWFHVALGDNAARRRVALRLEEAGWLAATLVHPSVVRARGTSVGAGCYVGAASVMCPESELGRHVIVNIRATVGHDAVVGDFAQLCPGAQINGRCRVGAMALVGSGASMLPGVTIGDGATVGAGAQVVRDVAAGTTVYGVPARLLASSS